MTTTTVYRIAHSIYIYDKTGTNYGPYCMAGMTEDTPNLDSAWGDTDAHPLPQDDGMGYLHVEYVCGFESMEQLHAWFSQGELDELFDCNFVLQIWEVPAASVVYGGKQVAFIHRSGRIVNVQSLEDLYVPC